MRLNKESNPFLTPPTDGTAYCPTKGGFCSARQACLTRFNAAKAVIEPPKESNFRHLYSVAASSLGRSFMMLTPISTTDVESLSTAIRHEEVARAKQEATSARALLERNCNHECIIEDAMQGPAYSTLLPEANFAVEAVQGEVI
jgi:hypothetical protein